MYNSEKQLTTRVSKIAYEETFMNVDTPDTSFDPQIGYRFPYPSQWQDNPSAKKVIGLRSLKITPTTHSISLILQVYTNDNPPVQIGSDLRLSYGVLKNDGLESIMNDIAADVETTFLNTIDVGGTDYLVRFDYAFDADDNNSLTMIVNNTLALEPKADPADPDIPERLLFKFYYDVQTNLYEFMRLLNQDNTVTIFNSLSSNSKIKKLYGVWDRIDLYFHSSFSTSRRGLIGRNDDFWQTPSKKYPFKDNTNDFYVWFTTDGVHRIFPYYCKFYLELSFILNYEHSLN